MAKKLTNLRGFPPATLKPLSSDKRRIMDAARRQAQRQGTLEAQLKALRKSPTAKSRSDHTGVEITLPSVPPLTHLELERYRQQQASRGAKYTEMDDKERAYWRAFMAEDEEDA